MFRDSLELPSLLMRSGRWCWISGIACCLLVLAGCPRAADSPEKAQPKEAGNLGQQTLRLQNLIETEDLLLDLNPRLVKMCRGLEAGLADPGAELPADLSECENVEGLAPGDAETLLHTDSHYPDFVKVAYWPLAAEPVAAAHPWASLQSLQADWSTLKLGVVSGDFTDESRRSFRLLTKAEGRGRSRSGPDVYGLKGQQELTFTLDAGRWTLSHWKQTDLKLIRADRPLFEEVLTSALPDAAAREKAQRSYMDEIILATSKSGTFELPDEKYVPWTTMTADHVFPSVAVVDYDGDGWDDLFLTSRWGPTQMLKNQGDGTFVDVADEVGLRFPYLVNCALFVDLDNDGDPDAILGRPMEPARYFLNEGGKFTDVSHTHADLGDQPLYFVSAISAADVNRDGLLDLYLSTYPPLAKQDTGFEHQFLNEFERRKYLELREANDRWVDTPGTPNVLLMNRGGGKLERIPYDEAVSQWRRSYQSVWGDVDGDGDDDLYICNDFAPDALLRNDTPAGAADPVFTDVTASLLIQDGIGFGMGASFGDFDADGDLDLYVSNMFSKAGNRIFNKLDSVDERLRSAAAGCFLYVNQEGKLTQSAGSQPGQFAVNQVGWSYGGQWADLDNDGQLDLYVPTGFYTAPTDIDTQVDL